MDGVPIHEICPPIHGWDLPTGHVQQMYPSTPIDTLISESGLSPAQIMLDFRQRKYAHLILSLSDSIPTKEILPVTLRIGDRNTQPNKQPENDAIWASNERITNYGQQLA